MDLQVTAAKLTGDPERDVKALSNHVFQLEEQLRYQLRNLDVTNFNDLGLARYENGRLQIYTKAVEVQTEKLRVEFGKETGEIYAQISLTAEELLAEIKDVDGNYTTLTQTVNGLSTRVGNVEGNYSSLTQTVEQIQTTISGSGGLQSQITQTSKKISAVVSAVDDTSGNVTAASIVAAINGAESSVKISADHITLSGVVTVEDLAGDGAVQINAGNIMAGGTITGCAIKTKVGSVTSMTMDEDSIRFGSFGRVQMGIIDGDYSLYVQSYGRVDLIADNGTRIYIDGSTGRYWQFEAWGLCLYNNNGEPYSYINATRYE